MTPVFVVQANARDHGGEILLVTRDEDLARARVREHVLAGMSPTLDGDAVVAIVREDAARLSGEGFCDKYAGNAWVDSAFYSEWGVE